MTKIAKYLFVIFFLAGLSSCVGVPDLPFETMDETELALYNASATLNNQIVCEEEIAGVRIFSGAISFQEEIEISQVGSASLDERDIESEDQPKLCLSIRELKHLRWWGTYRDEGTPGGGFSGGDMQPADAADYPSTFN